MEDKEKKIAKIIRRIDRALLELQAETGESHISAFIINNSVVIHGFSENNTINYYRNGVKK